MRYDGAKTDLIIGLIEVIQSIPIHTNKELLSDERIVGYISNSLKNKYINLSKKNSLIVNSEIELNTDIIGENSYSTADENLFIYEILNKLPEFQKEIIKSIYFNNISVINLAKQMHISRQAEERSA